MSHNQRTRQKGSKSHTYGLNFDANAAAPLTAGPPATLAAVSTPFPIPHKTKSAAPPAAAYITPLPVSTDVAASVAVFAAPPAAAATAATPVVAAAPPAAAATAATPVVAAAAPRAAAAAAPPTAPASTATAIFPPSITVFLSFCLKASHLILF